MKAKTASTVKTKKSYRRLRAHKLVFQTAERQWDDKDYRTGPVRPFPEAKPFDVAKRYKFSSGERPVRHGLLTQAEVSGERHPKPTRVYVPSRKPKKHGTYAATLAAVIAMTDKLRASSTSLRF